MNDSNLSGSGRESAAGGRPAEQRSGRQGGRPSGAPGGAPAAPAGGLLRERGSVLVLVVGVLALMAILVTIYATLGQSDRRVAAGLVQFNRNQRLEEDVSGFLADVVARGQFQVQRQTSRTSQQSAIRQPNNDRFRRTMTDNPGMDPQLQSQTLDPALRYTQSYLSIDNVPNGERRPPSGFTPGSVLTPWNRDEPDPRVAFTPFLAHELPGWFRTLERNNQLTQPRDADKPHLDYRDWLQISNPAPDGQFVNLANLRNNFFAKSGVGLERQGAFGSTNRGRMSYGLTLLDRNGNSTLDLALPPFWPFQRTKIDWNATGPAGQILYYPSDFTVNQISAFRPAVDNRTAAARAALPRPYTGQAPATIVPGDWEYLLNQWADADGDGVLDSRWFELRLSADPGPDRQFNTDDDVVQRLLREDPSLRVVVAARIADASAKVNVNTATQFRTPPSAANPAGLYPSDVDLERVLRMADVYQNWPRQGYEALGQPAFAYAAGGEGFSSNYRDNVNFGGLWTDAAGRQRRIADDVGGAGFSSLIEDRAKGLLQVRAFQPTPNLAAAWDPAQPILRQHFRPLTVAMGVYPFFAYPGQTVDDPSAWKAEDRAKIYRLFTGEPARTLSSRKVDFLFPSTRDLAPPFDTGLAPNSLNGFDVTNQLSGSIRAGSVISPTQFDIQDEIELRSREGVNDPAVTSHLESAVGHRFAGAQGQFLHLSPLRDNRSLDLELLSRDIVLAGGLGGAQRGADGRMDDDAYLQPLVDVRRQLTVNSGARPLGPTDVTGSESRLTEKELKVDLATALSVINGLTYDQLQVNQGENASLNNIGADQRKRQSAISSIMDAAADALLPFAALSEPGVNPRNSSWYVRGGNEDTGRLIPRAEHKLHYGGDRATYDGAAPYRGNSAEFALRTSAHLTANLIAGRQQFSTYVDPANPIHPDDRLPTLLSQTAREFEAFRGPLGPAVINAFAYPPVSRVYGNIDQDYYKWPRFPRFTGSTMPNQITTLRLQNFGRDYFYTDAYEFYLNRNSTRPTQVDLRRTRSEAVDRPVVMSLLIDEAYRGVMGGIYAFDQNSRRGFSQRTDIDGAAFAGVGAAGGALKFPLYPGWADDPQYGDLAPRVRGKLDLGSSKLCPPVVTPPAPVVNPRLDPQLNPDALLSSRAMNVYGITPQPFIVQALVMNMYADTPPSGGGDDEVGSAGGGGGGGGTGTGGGPGGQPQLDTIPVTVKGRVIPSTDRDSTGQLRPLGHSANDTGLTGIRGNQGFPDHLVEIVAFQLHNPFDAPLSLSKLSSGRTVPDQTRIRFQGDPNANAGATQLFQNRTRRDETYPIPGETDPFAVHLDETRYYIEFSGRYYALVGLEGDGNGSGEEIYRSITLEPGETRWFYACDNDFATVWTRWRAAGGVLMDELNNVDPSQTREPWRPVDRWIREQLMTFEPLGMSYDSASNDPAVRPSFQRRQGLPDAQVNDQLRRNFPPLAGAAPGDRNPVKDIKRAIFTDSSNASARGDARDRITFDNPPTRLVRVNPRTMQQMVNEPQPLPVDPKERFDFYDSRRAVRLWRVVREVHPNDTRYTSEGEIDASTGEVIYHRGGTGRARPAIPNILANDQLVDVLRDPQPWRRAVPPVQADDSQVSGDTSDNFPFPTLYRRTRDDWDPAQADGETSGVFMPDNDAIAFINWGSIRRPADPKTGMPLFRDRLGGAATDPANAVLPQVAVGVIPAYCMEVKSSLPYRAGIVNTTLAPDVDGRAIRTSLNFELINGKRRLKENLDSEAETSFDTFRLANLPSPGLVDRTRPEFGRVARGERVSNRVNPRVPGLPTLLKLGMGFGVNGGPVRLHQTINLAPQLQDITTGFSDTRRKASEPIFDANPTDSYKQVLKDRLERLRNRSGRNFSQLAMQVPMVLPRVYRGEVNPAAEPEMRPADILMVPAVGPYETPVDIFGAFQYNIDKRWTTFSEAVAQALDYDYDGDVDGWPRVNGSVVMPADYRAGASFKSLNESILNAQNQGFAYPPDEAPEVLLTGDIDDTVQLNTEIGGALERGLLRTDRFVAYLDMGDDRGGLRANGVFDPARDQSRSGRLVGDERLGSGIPLALTLLDKFRTTSVGSLTSKVPGTINANTAPRSVLRAAPMLTPDRDGWMGPNARLFNNYPGSVRDTEIIGGGRLVWGDLFSRIDLRAFNNNFRASQALGLYSNVGETFDIASTLEAYRQKSVVSTRSLNQENQPNGFRLPIDVAFRDDLRWPVDGRYGVAGLPGGRLTLSEPPMGRQFFTGIPGLREQTGFAGIGEIMCARYAGQYDPAGRIVDAANRPFNYQQGSIPNLRDLKNEYGADNYPRQLADPLAGLDRARGMDYAIDISIDRFARDGAKLAPTVQPPDYVINDPQVNFSIANGYAVEGLTRGVRDPEHQRGPLIPSMLRDDPSEKYAIANAALNSLSVRSDVFCVWFVVRGYRPTDVVVADPEDPMVPSLDKRFLMVVDRSNVTQLGEKPKVLFLQEVPVN